LLITGDDTLWPQIGAPLGNQFLLKQLDSVDELLAATPSGQAAIVLWDARDQTDAATVLSRLQLHSARFAVVALDHASAAHAWTSPTALRQVVAHVAMPLLADGLKIALDSAHEEVDARTALLGDGDGDGAAAAAAAASAGRTHNAGTTAALFGSKRNPWIAASIAIGVLVAAAAAVMVFRHKDASVNPAPASHPVNAPSQGSNAPPQAGNALPGTDEKIDLVIEKAQQAMRDRHFIEPADGSALTLYRNALQLDPDNGEAHQGLQRLAEILFTRVQSALDERKFDAALQALESARSINPDDGRLSALDERIASLRAEFGPAQILAAINAQNFDRATQLIDEAVRTKSLSNAKLIQLRDELRRRREEFDIANLIKLIDARLQQDKITEPRNDSAAYYLAQARAAGASAAALQSQSQDIFKRLTQVVHAAIEQRRLGDADRWVSELHTYGVPAATIAGLQHDVNAARTQQAAAVPEQPQYLELAQSRLAQGKVTEPDNDSALYYVNQLRTADPKNSGLTRISNAVQAQVVEQARAALDANQPARAEALLQAAAGLGGSADLTALNQRLAQLKQAAADAPEVVEASLTRIKAIELDYPEDALRRNVEGWVDVAYAVTTEGKVNSVKVLASNPAGTFDKAATRALSRARYKPMMQAGKPIAVSTKLRIAFRLAK
jgi:protein TonB